MNWRPVAIWGAVGVAVASAGFGLAGLAGASAAPAGGMEPGEYHTVITYSQVRGLPPAMAQGLMSRPHLARGCLKTSDINAVVEDAIAAGAGMTCSQDHGSAVGGVISGLTSCRDERGDSGTLTLKGRYSATHADVDASLEARTQMGPVSEHFHLASDRAGGCG